MHTVGRILIACEFSGIVQQAFRDAGALNVASCDLLLNENTEANHFQMDVLELLRLETFDLMIAFPPCTYLCNSGSRWNARRRDKQLMALNFVKALMNADVPRICIENPFGLINSAIRRPDQVIQPWMFGHPFTKSTCLWLKNLPKLTSTQVVQPLKDYTISIGHKHDRWKERSRTFFGVAEAMAQQWSPLLVCEK